MTGKNDSLWLFKSYAEQDDVDAVVDVIERGTWWANGPEIEEFEEKIAARTSREYAIAVNSGTTAIYAMLMTYGVTDGEVIVPSFTFPATANAVVAAGAKPVFADIERDSLSLDVDSVKSKVTENTRAVMPIHFGGDVARDIFELQELCQRKRLLLFEDACHSLGARHTGNKVGSFGDAATFSFCFNKVITTGEGGMVVTDSEEIKRSLNQFRSHGRNEDKEYVTYGHNFRMSSMAAALGVTQAQKLDYIIERRRQMAQYLNEALAEVNNIICPQFPDERESIYQLYNVRFSEEGIQQSLAEHLDERGIPTRITYSPTHLTRYYRNEWGYKHGDLPVTEDVSNKILTLPFHLDLTEKDLDRIIEGIKTYFERYV
jgi:dTDP-4-amino-4,6-dideoxygalactose transaminase